MLIKQDEKGVALITMLLFLVIVTALATGALMMATVQVKVSGSLARWEAGLSAAEGGQDFTPTLIASCQYDGMPPTVPSYTPYIKDQQFCGLAVPGNIDATGAVINEVNSPSYWASIDDVRTTPDLNIPVGDFSVNVDIDALGPAAIAGGSANQASAYQGAVSFMMSGYAITSRASSPDGRVNVQSTKMFWLRTNI